MLTVEILCNQANFLMLLFRLEGGGGEDTFVESSRIFADLGLNPELGSVMG